MAVLALTDAHGSHRVLDAYPPPRREVKNETCNAGSLSGLIGKPYSELSKTDALRESGAKSLRKIGPDIPASADYLSDRLSVWVEHEVIVGFLCG